MIDIDNAMVARWNAAGLNSTIATLYPGDDVPTPEGGALPRANYYSTTDPLESETRGSLVKVKQYTFEAWGTSYEAAAGYVKTIAAALLNSENSSSGALQISIAIGRILSTHEIDQMTEKHDDQTFCGRYEMSVRWQRAKAVP